MIINIKKNRMLKMLSLLLSAFLLTSCSSNSGQNSESIQNADNASQQTTAVSVNTAGSENAASVIVTSDMISYEKDDEYSEWESQNPTYIELNGNSAVIKGSGAAMDGGKISITAAGVYAFSGKLDNGQIIIDVQDKGTVRLVLNGAEISCENNVPIYVKNAAKTVISLPKGTRNVITDGDSYTLDGTADDEPNSAIFSKDDLTINGSGSLIVNANYNNGITGKDDLKITGGNINIKSKDDGIIGRDMVLVKDGSITVEADGDGIRATNDTEATKGFIAVEGGSIKITAGTDGIQAATSMLLAGGELNITTGGGSINSSTKIGGDRQNMWGKWEKNKAIGGNTATGGNATTGANTSAGGNTTIDGNTAAESEDSGQQSAKGLKAASDISISGSKLVIDSSDDAIHSNNSINIREGDISILSGDDGIHADSIINIKDGKINISKSYEGIESMVVTVSDGEIHVVSSDDGINVNGGKDGSSMNGRPGQNTFSVSTNSIMNINGGYISVNASGDGLDSNGSINFTDGTVVVSGPTSSGNGALDYNGTFEISGGFLVAAGSAGMAEAPSEQSSQYSINMFYPGIQKAGTLVHLEDSKGNTVVTFAPEKDYQSVVISSPGLVKDGTYTIYSGGTATGSVTNGLYTGGVYKNGTKVVDFTITSNVTWLSESGVTDGRSFNQGFNQGGGRNKGEGRPNMSDPNAGAPNAADPNAGRPDTGNPGPGTMPAPPDGKSTF